MDIHPTHEVSPSQLAREAIEHGAEMIIVSGGDGTVSAAAEAVINRTKALTTNFHNSSKQMTN